MKQKYYTIYYFCNWLRGMVDINNVPNLRSRVYQNQANGSKGGGGV